MKFEVDDTNFISEFSALEEKLRSVYGTPGERVLDIREGCRNISVVKCIQEHTSDIHAVWDFKDHACRVSLFLMASGLDGKVVLSLEYDSLSALNSLAAEGL